MESGLSSMKGVLESRALLPLLLLGRGWAWRIIGIAR